MLQNNNVLNNLKAIKKEIKNATELAQLKKKINLVAVSKTINSHFICEAEKSGKGA